MELLMNRYVVLVCCVLSTSVGHVLFKSAANTSKTLNSIWGLAFEPVFIGAVFLYAMTTVAYLWCLQDIPLSKAYLFMSLAYVFVPLMSWYFFGEIINWRYMLSTVLIITGIGFAMNAKV